MIFKIVKSLLLTVLVIVAILQVVALFLPSTVTRPGPIEEVIPAQITGWRGEEIPLAETEELQNQTKEILRFDEAFSHRYTRGNDYITVYIAYWTPGKVPIRKVGVHTPDTCWVQNGWTREEREYAQVLDVDGIQLQPCEFGLFSIREHFEHVLFWHLVGGEVYSYKQHGMHNLFSPIKDLFSKGLNQKADQYFIRISSNQSLRELWNDPGVKELIKAVGKLGAFAPTPENHSAATASAYQLPGRDTEIGVTSL